MDCGTFCARLATNDALRFPRAPKTIGPFLAAGLACATATLSFVMSPPFSPSARIRCRIVFLDGFTRISLQPRYQSVSGTQKDLYVTHSRIHPPVTTVPERVPETEDALSEGAFLGAASSVSSIRSSFTHSSWGSTSPSSFKASMARPITGSLLNGSSSTPVIVITSAMGFRTLNSKNSPFHVSDCVALLRNTFFPHRKSHRASEILRRFTCCHLSPSNR
mmetsp:Transcript_22516/g.55842  ORF Transcript_22516/g.55842 Transcript_22516/m.55842 type:complete len:220 (-) Transcript_22516:35-694(-)